MLTMTRLMTTTRSEARAVSGILLLDKPAGMTSNRVLQRAKRLYRARKAGHAGTLDPLATGMLPVCFGSATRVTGMMLGARKQYRAVVRFGTATSTGDAEGDVIASCEPCEAIAESTIHEALTRFRGELDQVPPMYSALKHQGKRLYELARAGKEVPRPPRRICVHQFALEQCCWPEVTFYIDCSKGTYVRSLVTDLADALGTLAHVAELRRLGVGPFQESQLVTLETLERLAGEGFEALDQRLLGADSALVDTLAVTVSAQDALALRQGQSTILAGQGDDVTVRIYDARGQFVGLGVLGPSGQLRPSRIFPA
jgi:tRNA pseudouridine55 synthase